MNKKTENSTRNIGDVEVDSKGLAAKCAKCGKGVAYKLPLSLSAWDAMFKDFVDKHKECHG